MRTKAGTSKESISQKRFSEYKIPYFGINHQNIWEEKLNILNKEIENFSFENSIQFGILTRIRQSILQEAIEGKLTANWRQDNPIRKGDPEYDGAALLKKIKAEKQKMIGEGKIRKEKPIAPIKPDDVPFALPEGWVWTRLGETGNLKRGKSKHRPRNDVMLFKNGTYPFIQTGNVSDAKFNKDLIVSTNNFYNEFGLKQSEMQKKGTLCITIAANIAECGFLNFDACIPDSIVCFASINRVIDKYVYYFIKTAKANLEKFAPATAQKNINLGILGILPIPLPPLAEQRVIVDKVEKLFTMVDALELQTKERKEQAERLVRAVLREAFEK
ncbi:hypothetical protein AGMMS49928_18530 [Spirochaetia bacterium]|nr:hypothetical protein AGMMS49928_18530 [Spirochaetia bacterium]